jgi:hypothetical protein
LQDTVADKLLPAILTWLAEPIGPSIDNLARAERLGWTVTESRSSATSVLRPDSAD